MKPSFRGPIVGSIGLCLVLFGLAACGAGDEGGAQVVGIELSDVWTRPTAPGAESTAFYLTARNGTDDDDRLVGASSPTCTMTEIHLSSIDDGVMSMNPASADELTLVTGGELILEPGGLHVMCMGLVEPVVDGDQIDVTLEFEQAGSVTVQASAEP